MAAEGHASSVSQFIDLVRRDRMARGSSMKAEDGLGELVLLRILYVQCGAWSLKKSTVKYPQY